MRQKIDESKAEPAGIEAFFTEMEGCEPANQLTSGAKAAGAAAAIWTARGAA
jgi:hypothetical protein